MERLEKILIGQLYRLEEKIIYTPLVSNFEQKITEFGMKKDEEYKDCLNADLHIHSLWSDGYNTPDHIVKVAKRRKLEAVSITDHNTYMHWTTCNRAIEKYGLIVVPGIEVSTTDGHMISLFPSYQVDESVRKLVRRARRLSAEEAIELTHSSNGVAIAAHPGKMRSIGLEKLKKLGGLDGVEVFNPSAGVFYPTLADELKKAGIADSDSHWKVSIGIAQTLFPKTEIPSYKTSVRKSIEEIVECIRKKNTTPDYLKLRGVEYNVDKLRWLASFCGLKSMVEFFDDRNKVIARRIDEYLTQMEKF